MSVISALPKQVNDKSGTMHVPGQFGLAVVVVGACVVVVVVVVVVEVVLGGNGCLRLGGGRGRRRLGGRGLDDGGLSSEDIKKLARDWIACGTKLLTPPPC